MFLRRLNQLHYFSDTDLPSVRGWIDTFLYESASTIFRTDAVKIINLTTTRLLKLPTSTQLRATWHTDSLDNGSPTYTGTSCYYNCCLDGRISPEYFGYSLVRYTANSVQFNQPFSKRCLFSNANVRMYLETVR
jgi:hypothetical protein